MPANRKTNESRRLTVAGLIAVTAATLLMMAWAIFPERRVRQTVDSTTARRWTVNGSEHIVSLRLGDRDAVGIVHGSRQHQAYERHGPATNVHGVSRVATTPGSLERHVQVASARRPADGLQSIHRIGHLRGDDQR